MLDALTNRYGVDAEADAVIVFDLIRQYIIKSWKGAGHRSDWIGCVSQTGGRGKRSAGRRILLHRTL